jgi:hypothetical protein
LAGRRKEEFVMIAQIIKLATNAQRDRAKMLIDNAPVGYVVRLGEPTRNLDQNAKLHAMIADIQAQVDDMARFSAEDVKLRFMNALGMEMRFLPELDGAGVFPVGLKSSTLTVAQFSGLIELLYKYGAEHGVRWTERIERA